MYRQGDRMLVRMSYWSTWTSVFIGFVGAITISRVWDEFILRLIFHEVECDESSIILSLFCINRLLHTGGKKSQMISSITETSCVVILQQVRQTRIDVYVRSQGEKIWSRSIDDPNTASPWFHALWARQAYAKPGSRNIIERPIKPGGCSITYCYMARSITLSCGQTWALSSNDQAWRYLIISGIDSQSWFRNAVFVGWVPSQGGRG